MPKIFLRFSQKRDRQMIERAWRQVTIGYSIPRQFVESFSLKAEGVTIDDVRWAAERWSEWNATPEDQRVGITSFFDLLALEKFSE